MFYLLYLNCIFYIGFVLHATLFMKKLCQTLSSAEAL